MVQTFAVKSKSFSLYKAIKEEAEKLGWVYYDDFMDFNEENMKCCDCLYFSTDWPDYNGEFLFSFSNSLNQDKRYYLAGDWNDVIDHLKELNPAKGAVTNTMYTDPAAKQEATNEQATELESAAQDQAMEVDSEEGTTEG